jgi:hypothetical protein
MPIAPKAACRTPPDFYGAVPRPALLTITFVFIFPPPSYFHIATYLINVTATCYLCLESLDTAVCNQLAASHVLEVLKRNLPSIPAPLHYATKVYLFNSRFAVIYLYILT